jgi:adenylate cyclase
MFDVTFMIGESSRTFQVAPGANLLQAAIEAGQPIEYVCKQGRCCTCKVKVLQGEKNLSAPTTSETLRLGRDKIKRQWRLACQTKVNGPIKVSHNVFLGVQG